MRIFKRAQIQPLKDHILNDKIFLSRLMSFEKAKKLEIKLYKKARYVLPAIPEIIETKIFN